MTEPVRLSDAHLVRTAWRKEGQMDVPGDLKVCADPVQEEGVSSVVDQMGPEGWEGAWVQAWVWVGREEVLRDDAG